MTTIKLLSTGWIAIAMLTTSAVARENFAAGRRVIIRGAPSYMGNSPPPAAGLSGRAFQYGSVRRSGACPATFATGPTMRRYAEMRRIGGHDAQYLSADPIPNRSTICRRGPSGALVGRMQSQKITFVSSVAGA